MMSFHSIVDRFDGLHWGGDNGKPSLFTDPWNETCETAVNLRCSDRYRSIDHSDSGTFFKEIFNLGSSDGGFPQQPVSIREQSKLAHS
jgi:hypothetical protein